MKDETTKLMMHLLVEVLGGENRGWRKAPVHNDSQTNINELNSIVKEIGLQTQL